MASYANNNAARRDEEDEDEVINNTANIRVADDGMAFNHGPPEIDESEIEKIKEIGVGSFGKVYTGRCRQKPVAIKILHNQIYDKKTLLAFRREVRIMSKQFHPNICLFMGACTIPGKCMIVTELMPRGDLESMLRDKKLHLSLVTRMRFARDAALGMNWLHCSSPMIIHRDLKSSNLLVDENMNVKVCDFGLSQLIPRDKKVKDKQNAKGTPLWMAPEVMMFKEFNEKCDIYSYGIVLWEIYTREEPFSEFTSFDKFKDAICVRHHRPPIPPDCVPSLRDLMQACWDPDPSKRPSFKEIITSIDNIIIDCAIRDEQGKKFWKENFVKKEEVPWSDFKDALSKFLSLTKSEKNELNLKCLHAVLVEKNLKRENEDIVNIEQFGKILDWFGPLTATSESDDSGERETILDAIRKLLSKNWFHGDISTEEAQLKLSGLPGGTFLVRFSTTSPGCYTISQIMGPPSPAIKHQRVSYVPSKGYNVNNVFYNSLDDIIKEATSLLLPCPGHKYAPLFVAQPHSVFGYT